MTRLCKWFGLHFRKKTYDRGDTRTCIHCGDVRRLNWASFNPDTAGRMLARTRRRK